VKFSLQQSAPNFTLIGVSDRCLSVCLSCLSVSLVYCGQMVAWIKMKDETWLAGRARPWLHYVRWGPSSPSSKVAQFLPQFSAHICCGQMVGWNKMPLGMEVGLDPGDCVIWGPSSLPQKGPSSPAIFGLCLLWPNGWMD